MLPSPTSTSPPPPPPTAKRPRQQAGLACDECRRRKLRCDRGQPSCGACRDSGVECHRTTTRQPRGPKKGHLRALQSRIFALERRLSDQNLSDHSGDDGIEDELLTFPEEPTIFRDENEVFEQTVEPSFMDFFNPDTTDAFVRDAFNQDPLGSASSCTSAPELITPPSPPPLLGVSPADCISDMMRADLDHLYFDRAHIFCPILNKRRYFSRVIQPRRSNDFDAFACLQHAMWTLAVSMSSQFQHLQEDLYAHTRLLLDSLEIDPLNAENVQIEQVQAWVLLTTYEFMRVGFRRGWMSAGKCFRFAILMKLHCIDGRDGFLQPPLGLAEVEEARRTFWMAYTIDRFISLMDQLPLTFDQHVILTRLPVPEEDFQTEQPAITKYLFDPKPDEQPRPLSAFTESIQLVTLCGQSLSHQQQGTVEFAHGCFPLEFWDRHQRLDLRLTQSIDYMALSNPCALAYLDSMPLFTHMAAQAGILLLYKASQTAPWGLEDYQEVATKYEHRAVTAAHQMVALSRTVMQLSYFKIHPFTPVFLYLCGDFLRSNPQLDPTLDMQTTLHSALRCLVHVNKMAQDCLNRLQAPITPS